MNVSYAIYAPFRQPFSMINSSCCLMCCQVIPSGQRHGRRAVTLMSVIEKQRPVKMPLGSFTQRQTRCSW